MLRFWKKDFDKAIEKHLEFLKENVESQSKYSLKFSEILQQMEIFQNEENEQTNDENQDNSPNNPSNNDEENEFLMIEKNKVKRKKQRQVLTQIMILMNINLMNN